MSVVTAQGSADDVGAFTRGHGIRPFAKGQDCVKFGIWDRTTRTCTLATDLSGAIYILLDDATLDCAGHKLVGPGPGFGAFWIAGIFLEDSSENVTVKNCDISDHIFCILGVNNNSHTIERNYIHDCPRGIRFYGGSGNHQILNNMITETNRPIAVINNDNKISGNIIANPNTIANGIFVGGQGNEVSYNDISGAEDSSVFFYGSDNIIANNRIHDSAGIQMEYRDQEGPSGNNYVVDNVIEAGFRDNTCFIPLFLCDNGISLSAYRAQVNFNDSFGNGVTDNNTIAGNTILNFSGVGIELDNIGTNTVVSDNVITGNFLGGIRLAHGCPTCEYEFMRNDIVGNIGTPLISIDSSYDQDLNRTPLGPLAVDITGDDGLGNPIGNYWGRDDCPTGPFFVAGVDSNDGSVVDSNPFGIPVAGLASVPTPPGC